MVTLFIPVSMTNVCHFIIFIMHLFKYNYKPLACKVIFHVYVVVCWRLIQNNFFLTFFRNSIRVSNGLGPDQDRPSDGPDLGPICLQR